MGGGGAHNMRDSSNNPLGGVSNAGDKLAMLNKLKQQQKKAYDDKRANMLGKSQAVPTNNDAMPSLQLCGLMSLEQMDLDRKDDF